jgi:hypothetical protein
VIASMHLADVGTRRSLAILRRGLRPDAAAGLVHAQALLTAPLGGGARPRLQRGRVALFAIWEGDDAAGTFLDGDPLGRELSAGCSVRLAPVRASGGVAAMPDLVEDEQPVGDDEPVAVLTYGRLKAGRALAFLHASARAETSALMRPELVAGTGLTRPPRIVATFTLWRTAAGMRDFAYEGAAHGAALEATRRSDFHSESVFLRFRPYAATGEWGHLPEAVRAWRPAGTVRAAGA